MNRVERQTPSEEAPTCICAGRDGDKSHLHKNGGIRLGETDVAMKCLPPATLLSNLPNPEQCAYVLPEDERNQTLLDRNCGD